MAESETQRTRSSPGSRASALQLGHPITRMVLGALAIAVGSAMLGIVVNALSPRGIPLLPRAVEEARAEPALPLPPGLVAMDLEQARAAFDARSALFLDARKPEEYEQGHIPGALNLPPRAFEEHFLEAMDRVEAAASLVVYCEGSECSDAIETAQRLLETGKTEIYVFEGGWKAWVDDSGPVAKGQER